MKEGVKKESLLRETRERKEQIEEENSLMKKTVDRLEEKVKMLSKQVSKRDDHLKEMKNMEEK